MPTKSAAKKFLESLRKKKMDENTTQDQDVRLNLDTPVEEVAATAPEEEVIAEEKKTDETPEEEVVAEDTVIPTEISSEEELVSSQPTGPDETYNCKPCLGAGLIAATGKVCDNCEGTGKV